MSGIQTAFDPARQNRTLFVGGLADEATPALLKAAVLPFGNVASVMVPLDLASGKPKGFGFVEFEDAGDAADAVANMHNAELLGRTLSVNPAKPIRSKTKGVWESGEDWLDALAKPGGGEEQPQEAAS